MEFWGAISALTRSELERVLVRLRKNAVWIGIIAFLLLTAFVAFVVAADLALATLLGPIYAPLVIGGIALFIALVAWLGVSIANTRRRRLEQQKHRRNEISAALASAALSGLPELLKSPVVRKFGIPAGVLALIVLLGLGDRRDD